MPPQEVQTADAQARVMLPAAFADTAVVIEVLSASEVLIRKAAETTDQLAELPENSITVLSDRDRDRFLELLESPPTANMALERAIDKHRRRNG